MTFGGDDADGSMSAAALLDADPITALIESNERLILANGAVLAELTAIRAKVTDAIDEYGPQIGPALETLDGIMSMPLIKLAMGKRK